MTYRIEDDSLAPTRAEAERDAYEDQRQERTEDNACPECEDGIVLSIGRVEWETGHQPYGCDRCGCNG